MKISSTIGYLVSSVIFFQQPVIAQTQSNGQHPSTLCCSKHSVVSGRRMPSDIRDITPAAQQTDGMVWVPAGMFNMGSDNADALSDERPAHAVIVDGFWMDSTEVTNEQFERFVLATGYTTTAERMLDRKTIEKELPADALPIADSLLMPGSIVFRPSDQAVDLQDYTQWWDWKTGADWRHPQGAGSNIDGKEQHPVVHISWQDANAYCKWVGKRLPTEAEWEWAARGGLTANGYFPWGNEPINDGEAKANTWQGNFPAANTLQDGYYRTAPAASYPANGYKLYDMAGNVWEWCSDYYDEAFYTTCDTILINPKGPAKRRPFDESNDKTNRVIRGGSFLCNDSYCSGFRVTRRMKSEEDGSAEHIGFRCVKDK